MLPSEQGDHPVKASVIVVSWNCREYLMKCLESMLSRTRVKEVEWILVDNASSDGTAAEVKKRYPDVRLIVNQENGGFSQANNVGIMQSRGKYLFLVNPDVEFVDDCIGILCRFMDENPDVGLCGPRILNTDGTVQHSCRKLPSLWNSLCFALGLHRIFPGKKRFSNELMSWFDYNSQIDAEALSGCFLVARRLALKEVGLLDERFFMYSEDIDWCKRFRDRAWRVVFNPQTEALHHGGKSSEAVSVQSAVAQTKSKLIYWRKHHGAIKSLMIRGILVLRHLRVLSYALFLVVRGKEKEAAKKLAQALACISFLLFPERISIKLESVFSNSNKTYSS